MKFVKLFLMLLLGVFVVMQFFRPKKNIHKDPAARANTINKIAAIPANIAIILDKACNDCHSNNTKYPWYAEVMPAGWILDNHVKEGKKELNFDEFAAYQPKRQKRKLEEVAEEVREGKMPLKSYKRLHKGARLTEEEKEALIQWATSAAGGINVPPQTAPPPTKPE